MAIEMGGKGFYTRNERLYINDKLVRYAYVNGKLVYPDDREGDYRLRYDKEFANIPAFYYDYNQYVGPRIFGDSGPFLFGPFGGTAHMEVDASANFPFDGGEIVQYAGSTSGTMFEPEVYVRTVDLNHHDLSGAPGPFTGNNPTERTAHSSCRTSMTVNLQYPSIPVVSRFEAGRDYVHDPIHYGRRPDWVTYELMNGDEYSKFMSLVNSTFVEEGTYEYRDGNSTYEHRLYVNGIEAKEAEQSYYSSADYEYDGYNISFFHSHYSDSGRFSVWPFRLRFVRKDSFGEEREVTTGFWCYRENYSLQYEHNGIITGDYWATSSVTEEATNLPELHYVED